ncbi:peroxiredoxin-like family protein [Pseudonocardia sp. TRM90224]|uniref:peroxiredoxin-like family protein n=1 Tax=Pseudonocardia sp. TRM90224 TaxID=2812678 RepID=UPI001E557AFA|nr:peroxiredoxin-like family protein [Pseudonocardia sp. TRM90224]
MSKSYAEQVGAIEQHAAAHVPGAALAAFRAEQVAFDAAGTPDGVSRAGTPMPDAELLDAHGNPTSLTAARGGERAVVVFYRGAWCPYCNLALRTYQQVLLPQLQERGVTLIALSPQKPDGSLSMQETNELTFTVLSDPGNTIAGQLGILTSHSDDARAAQATLGLDVAGANADGTQNLPMPTVVIVEADGTIGWIDVRPNYATRTEPADIIAAL